MAANGGRDSMSIEGANDYKNRYSAQKERPLFREWPFVTFYGAERGT
jgi:hypothetical protein